MDMREIEAVCAVNAYRNYSEAAFHSSSSPSVISKQIARVEEELGIRIFERATKTAPVKLTPAGNDIIAHFKLIMNNYYQMISKVSAMKASMNESLTIGYQRHIGSFHERDILTNFSLDNPSVTLSYIARGTADLIQLLVNGTLSAAFISLMLGADELNTPYAELADPDFCITEIFTHTKLYVGLPEAHPLAHENVIRRENYPLLHNDTFLLPIEQKSENWSFQRNNIGNVLNNSGRMKMRFVDQSVPEVVLGLVERGYGVLPQACVVSRRIGNVYFVPLEDYGAPVITYFVYRRSSATPALLRLKQSVVSFAAVLQEQERINLAESENNL